MLRSVVKLYIFHRILLAVCYLDEDTLEIQHASAYKRAAELKPLTKVTIVYVHFLVAGIR